MSLPTGPLGINPLQFSIGVFSLLLFFVLYLLFPRAVRKQYFGSYPRRHAWSARSRRSRRSGGGYSVVRSDISLLQVKEFGFGCDAHVALTIFCFPCFCIQSFVQCSGWRCISSWNVNRHRRNLWNTRRYVSSWWLC